MEYSSFDRYISKTSADNSTEHLTIPISNASFYR